MLGITQAFVFKVFFGFFAIMNPIANTPIFLGVVEEFDEKEKRAIAFKCMLFAFLIVAAFCVAGKIIFDVFGITLPAFRITGGILIFHIGFELLQGNMSKIHAPSGGGDGDVKASANRIAVSPLAIPILAGPGTISTAMNFVAKGTMPRIGVTVAVFAFMCFVTYVMFIFGEKLVSFLGENVVSVISRLMGLILAVIGADMVIAGIKGAFDLMK